MESWQSGCQSRVTWSGSQPVNMVSMLVTHMCLYKDNWLSLEICYGEREAWLVQNIYIVPKKNFFLTSVYFIIRKKTPV